MMYDSRVLLHPDGKSYIINHTSYILLLLVIIQTSFQEIYVLVDVFVE